MSNIEDRFQKLIKEREETTGTKALITEDNPNFYLEKTLDFSILKEITSDQEIVSFLELKMKEIISLQAKSSLYLGKILSEINEELSKKGSPEGVYVKFLEINNMNKTTALRYRKRWELYNLVSSHSKHIIALLSHREIHELYKNQDILEDFYPGMKLEDAKDILQRNVVASAPTMELGFHSFLDNFSFLDKKYQKKIEKLDESKQKIVFDLLQQINNILE